MSQQTMVKIQMPVEFLAELNKILGQAHDSIGDSLKQQVEKRERDVVKATEAVEQARLAVDARLAEDERDPKFNHESTKTDLRPEGRFSPMSTVVKNAYVKEAEVDVVMRQAVLEDASFYLQIAREALAQHEGI